MIIPTLAAAPAHAEYASGGSGLHNGSIDWFQWGDHNDPMVSGTTKTNTRQIGDQTLATTCTIADLSGDLRSYRPGSYPADGLDDLYNIGGTGNDNQLVVGLANVLNAATVNFHFSCSVALDGLPVPLGGLVIADAETSGSSEYIQATPDQDATWRIIDRYRETCDVDVIATRTGSTLRLAGENDLCGAVGPMAVGFMQGATSAQVEMKGGGVSAIALGVVLDVDYGDAPETYGTAGALVSAPWNGGTVPEGVTPISDDDFALATRGEPVTRLGSTVDADVAQNFSADSLGDDIAGSADEDALVPAPIAASPGGTYTLPGVACTGPGFVAGWIDWNKNGTFDETEGSTPVECTGASVALTWAVPLDAVESAGADTTVMRLRVAGTADGVASATGLSATGEVEDHAVNVELPHLSVAKTSDATTHSRVGDTISYTVTATNSGDTDFTEAYPATVRDSLTGVVDDGDYADDAVATIDGSPAGAVTLAGDELLWSGALAAGSSVQLHYTVTLIAGGDGHIRNVAFAGTEITPACDPADAGGLDPVTGVPCAEHEIFLPRLTISKTSDTQELPAVGGEVTYTITATNTGEGHFTAEAPATITDDLSDVIDDATYSDDASATLPGALEYSAPNLSWVGALPAGESVSITYSATYTGAGDNILVNMACVPASDTAPGAEPCDSVTVPGAALTQWKTVSASSDPVVAGTELSYTLFFENTGQSAATVDTIDDLSRVIDDAEVTVEPSSPDGLSSVRTGDRIAVTGDVPAGETYSVTYTVTVKPDGERGDDIAANFLLQDASIPLPPTCAPSDEEFPDCTTTPIAAVTYAKSVEADTDPIAEGTILTYRVTVTNTGAAAGTVSREDVLTDVLDDTTMTQNPTSDTTSVTVTDVVNDRFAIGGTIAAGATATITYKVAVNDELLRTNNRATNFLVAPGEVPPTECEPGQCTDTPLPNVSTAKSVDPSSGSTVIAGQVVTYTLTFSNSGDAAGRVAHADYLANVLDDADITSVPVSSDDALTLTDITDGAFGIDGILEPGQTVTVVYQATVRADGNRGDNVLGNVLAEEGDTPDPVCETDDPNCTTNPVPEIVDSKSVDPASTTPVVAGQELTYTLTFENTGKAAGAVNKVDNLVHVIDDADIVTEPVSSDAALSVAKDGNQYVITGELGAGQKVTVSYTVIVKAAADRGDGILANYLVEKGTVPPVTPICEAAGDDSGDCTVNPVGDIRPSKTVDPATGTVVKDGQTLTYTLSFENTGQGSASVDYTDHLGGVLDDAEWTGNLRASNELVVSGPADNALHVVGNVAAGETATVTYQVRVKAYAAQADHKLGNFLAVTGENPPTTCVTGNPLCTNNPTDAPPTVDLAETGVETIGATLGALMLLVLGGGALMIRRRNRTAAMTGQQITEFENLL